MLFLKEKGAVYDKLELFFDLLQIANLLLEPQKSGILFLVTRYPREKVEYCCTSVYAYPCLHKAQLNIFL